MITNADYIEPSQKGRYSPLQVLKSAAGYYIGTIYTDEYGDKEPGSRDSGYFATQEKAQQFLDTVSSVANPQDYLRDHP
ncbi:hypothetical protein G3574_03655 [Noviherbaspirillum sp. 17J57-3]|uniref:Uncharacterized protein n=2 Tax=Noviherbaspirillum galbum TaxID=2709383 RepID=A0A6B3SN36_9BURK|nr:hypothetical protein [Noviherbaspirillum galbum]NEX60166.1 hypothetical protein [Noviherbaspirillum galbum]